MCIIGRCMLSMGVPIPSILMMLKLGWRAASQKK
jgi:hypothetical protein